MIWPSNRSRVDMVSLTEMAVTRKELAQHLLLSCISTHPYGRMSMVLGSTDIRCGVAGCWVGAVVAFIRRVRAVSNRVKADQQ